MERCRILDPTHPEPAIIQEAARILRRGGVVAYPTDTVYGLAVDAFNEAAVARLYAVKQRAADKAIPLIIGALEQLVQVCVYVPPIARRLITACWPGPLTLLLEPHTDVPALIRGDSPYIGVRWPASPISQALALALGRAITASSANLAGRPAALCAAEVVAQLASAVDMILDGGVVGSSEVSTILDVLVEPPRIVRAGKISQQVLEEILDTRVVGANPRRENVAKPPLSKR
jgi:L-threonylcarbamoyladenylate synthase